MKDELRANNVHSFIPLGGPYFSSNKTLKYDSHASAGSAAEVHSSSFGARGARGSR
jgi:hypothetical protein